MGKVKIKKIRPTISFVGSCVQQDFGEAVSKGVLVWDINSMECQYIQVKNDYSFVKLYSEDLSKVELTKYVHLRYISERELNEIEKANLEKNIRDQVSQKGSLILSYNCEEELKDIQVNIDTDVENIYDTKVQNEMLKDSPYIE